MPWNPSAAGSTSQQDPDNVYPTPGPQVVVASAARTVTGNQGNVQQRCESSFLAVLLDITAASGTTPSLTLMLQWSNDGTNWFDADPVDTFSASSGAGKKARSFAKKANYFRFNWAISGTTPSFTFSVSVTPVGA